MGLFVLLWNLGRWVLKVYLDCQSKLVSHDFGAIFLRTGPLSKLQRPLSNSDSRCHLSWDFRELHERDLCSWLRKGSYYWTKRSVSIITIAVTLSDTYNNCLSLSVAKTTSKNSGRNFDGRSCLTRTTLQPLQLCHGCHLRRSTGPIAKLLLGN